MSPFKWRMLSTNSKMLVSNRDAAKRSSSSRQLIMFGLQVAGGEEKRGNLQIQLWGPPALEWLRISAHEAGPDCWLACFVF